MSAEVIKPSFGKKVGRVILIVLGIFIALVVLGAIVGEEDKGNSTPVTASNEEQRQTAVADDQAGAEEEQADSLTGPQRNAARSAKQYLDMTGFSRDGLIDQLSSDAGNGYEVADATAAVDSLNVDWNEQAARSAKQYLDMTGFSCKGLIDQLSSSAGSQYTKREATYGAQQAGAC